MSAPSDDEAEIVDLDMKRRERVAQAQVSTETASLYANGERAAYDPFETNAEIPAATERTLATEEEMREFIEGLGFEHLKAKAELVYDLMVMLRTYIVVSEAKLLVIALWIIHTHCIDAAEQTPYLAVTSPEPRCGKSRLLEMLNMLTANAWKTILPSEAVVYRHINNTMPTLLLDEVDAIFNPKLADRYEGLRALLNEGNNRGAKVPRCVGTSNNIQEFSTFCARRHSLGLAHCQTLSPTGRFLFG